MQKKKKNIAEMVNWCVCFTKTLLEKPKHSIMQVFHSPTGHLFLYRMLEQSFPFLFSWRIHFIMVSCPRESLFTIFATFLLMNLDQEPFVGTPYPQGLGQYRKCRLSYRPRLALFSLKSGIQWAKWYPVALAQIVIEVLMWC